jgi:hypothetical protein
MEGKKTPSKYTCKLDFYFLLTLKKSRTRNQLFNQVEILWTTVQYNLAGRYNNFSLSGDLRFNKLNLREGCVTCNYEEPEAHHTENRTRG